MAHSQYINLQMTKITTLRIALVGFDVWKIFCFSVWHLRRPTVSTVVLLAAALLARTPMSLSACESRTILTVLKSSELQHLM